MIGIIDYGVGNIQAFLNLSKRIKINAKRVVSCCDFDKCSHLILPGVGHFDHAMQSFNNSGLRTKLERLVLKDKTPILGVCVGMQMLADSSDEGVFSGLGWIPGKVHSMEENPSFSNLRKPHMGWNTLIAGEKSQQLLASLDKPSQFYFLHSYYFDAVSRADVVASAKYGAVFDVFVSKGNIHGVQFHPEKSHHWGQQLIKNFVGIT